MNRTLHLLDVDNTGLFDEKIEALWRETSAFRFRRFTAEFPALW
jgi:hypothetical protein